MIFKIATIGILVTIINQLLQRSGKDEYVTLTSIAGAIIVILMIAKEVASFFETIKTLFNF